MTFFHFKYIFLIVVSVMLTTISSCASSRRMDKNKTTEQLADKRNTSSTIDSTAISTTKIGTSNFKLTDNTKYNDNLDIEYTPTFDKNGNLIPFHYSKEENGKKTNVNITGNAKVKSSSSNEKINNAIEQEKLYTERKKALGFKILKPTLLVKYGYLSIQFEKKWKGKRWAF